MKKHDRVGGLIWFVLGAALCIGSINLKLGDFHRPGPGFMPFLSGAVLSLLGLILVFSSKSKAPEGEGKGEGVTVWSKGNWKIFVFSLCALFGYVLLLERLGFLVTNFLFLFLLFKLREPRKRFLMSFTTALITVSLSYLIFSVWLKSQFPRGILGF